MTKKHFIELANTLKDIPTEELKEGVRYVGYADMVLALADFCESANPQFNRTRWLAYLAGNCGPNGGAIKPSKAA